MNLPRLPPSLAIANALRRCLPRVVCTLAVMLLAVLSATLQAAEPFLEPGKAFVPTVDQASPIDEVRLNWTIAPGNDLYRDHLLRRHPVAADPS